MAESWEFDTAALTDQYQSLEVAILDQDGQLTGTTLPVVPVEYNDAKLTILIPHEYVTWLPPVLVALADGEGNPSADGFMTTGAFIVMAAGGGAALMESTGRASWVEDGRWPAARSVVQLSQNIAGEITLRQVVMLRDFSDPELPPTEYTLSPTQINNMFYGAVENGAWSGLMGIVWPPPEP